MTRFDITPIVLDVGESVAISGVSKTFNEWGDSVESFVDYALSGVVQVMDGSEEEVEEGILNKEDIIMFVSDDETDSDQLVTENYVTVVTTTSGVFRIVNVVHNPDHYEVWAKRILKT